jgi:hypothetical protein
MPIPGTLARLPVRKPGQQMRCVCQKGRWWTRHWPARGGREVLQGFDANHVGAVVCQHHGGIGTSPHDGKVKYPNTAEWQRGHGLQSPLLDDSLLLEGSEVSGGESKTLA